MVHVLVHTAQKLKITQSHRKSGRVNQRDGDTGLSTEGEMQTYKERVWSDWNVAENNAALRINKRRTVTGDGKVCGDEKLWGEENKRKVVELE